MQVTAEKYRDRLSGASRDDEVSLMYGTDQVRGGVPVCPALAEWVSEELKRENTIAKERRKAREERQLNRPGKPPKGGSKGQQQTGDG